MGKSFNVTSISYDAQFDVLTATVNRSNVAFHEAYEIVADFNCATFSIADICESIIERPSSHYVASILAAFLRDFDARYHALTHEASPGDVQAFAFTISP